MNFVVRAVAIRSPMDLVVKPAIFLTFLVVQVAFLENTLMAPEKRQPIAELLPILLSGGSLLALIFFSIVTHQYHLQQALVRMATTDELTALPNRRAFLNAVELNIAHDPEGYLLIADADYFKRINDTHGHGAGDLCLQAIADLLRQSVTRGDWIGRIGGEEFGIYLAAPSPDYLEKVGEKLINGVKLQIGDQLLTITLSVGAARISEDMRLKDILQHADTALYQAKAQGRARLECWPPHKDLRNSA